MVAGKVVDHAHIFGQAGLGSPSPEQDRSLTNFGEAVEN
jgi:hypothetical protein